MRRRPCALRYPPQTRGDWVLNIRIRFQEWHKGQFAIVVFGLTLLAYLLLVPYVSRYWQLTGDEPHYLAIAHSLAYDGDLQLENNYRDGIAEPHIVVTSDGSWRPMHMIGLPLLLSLPLRLGDRLGILVFLNIVAALVAANVYLLAYELSSDQELGIAAWLVTAFVPPLLIYAFLIYPEMPGALLIIWSVRQITGPPLRSWRWFLVGAAIAFLPWLVIRFAPIAALLGFAALAKIFGVHRGRHVLQNSFLLALPGLISIAAYLLYQRLIFGTLSPLGNYAGTGQPLGLPALSVMLGALPGWLLDQRSGLLVYAPLYMLSFAGYLIMARERRSPTLFLTSVIILQILFGTVLPGFWVQWSPPTRYLVSVLPLVTIGVAYAWRRVRGPFGVVLPFLFLTISLVNGWVTFSAPKLSYNQGYQRAKLLQQLGQWIHVDITQGYPLFETERRYKARPGIGQDALLLMPGTETAWMDGGQQIQDSRASFGVATLAEEDLAANTVLLRGGTVDKAMSGRFVLRVRLRMPSLGVSGKGDALLATINVWGKGAEQGQGSLVGNRAIYVSQLAAGGQYQWLELPFANPSEQRLEFSVVYGAQVPVVVDSLGLVSRVTWWQSWGLALVWAGFIVLMTAQCYRQSSVLAVHPVSSSINWVDRRMQMTVLVLSLLFVSADTLSRTAQPIFEAESLPRTIGGVRRDPIASGGWAVLGSVEDGAGALVYGPYYRLEAGQYRLRYRLKLSGPATRQTTAGTLEVACNAGKQILASRVIAARDLDPDSYRNLVLDLTLAEPKTLEFRVLFPAEVGLWVDYIQVIPE